MAYFTPFSVRTLADNVHYRQVLDGILEVLEECFSPESDMEINLECAGTYLKQLSWSDETGYYVKLRKRPFSSGTEEGALRAANIFARKLPVEMGWRKLHDVQVEAPSEGNPYHTVVFVLQQNSVPD